MRESVCRVRWVEYTGGAAWAAATLNSHKAWWHALCSSTQCLKPQATDGQAHTIYRKHLVKATLRPLPNPNIPHSSQSPLHHHRPHTHPHPCPSARLGGRGLHGHVQRRLLLPQRLGVAGDVALLAQHVGDAGREAHHVPGGLLEAQGLEEEAAAQHRSQRQVGACGAGRGGREGCGYVGMWAGGWGAGGQSWWVGMWVCGLVGGSLDVCRSSCRVVARLAAASCYCRHVCEGWHWPALVRGLARKLPRLPPASHPSTHTLPHLCRGAAARW